MSGTHARRRPRRIFDTIDSALQRSGINRALQADTAEPTPAVPPVLLSKPFDGRHRPVEVLPPQPLGPRPTPSPDPERNEPVDEATEAVYRGLQAHFDQYRAPFGHAI